MENKTVKPSRSVAIDDIITVRKSPYTFKYKVKGLIGKRVSAKIASGYFEDLTPPEDILKIKTIQESAFFTRERGTGRPTKKDRRTIDRFRT